MKPLIIACLASACASLPEVAANECGNGIVEAGEDCDTKDASCYQCSFTCSDGQCPTQFPDYVCGADLLCHAPSGVFHRDATGTFAFPGFQPYVTDVNGDAVPDVIALSQSSMTIVYGDPGGALQDEISQVTPLVLSNGGFALRSFGTPAQPQILLATADGIAGFVPQSKQLLPYPFAIPVETYYTGCAALATSYVPLTVFPFDGGHVNALVRHTSDNTLALVVVDLITGQCGVAPACGLAAPAATMSMTGQPPYYTDTYVTSPSLSVASEVLVIGLPPPQGQTTGQACLMRANAPATGVLGTFTLEAIGSARTVPGQQAALAQISANAAGCPSYLTGTATGGITALVPSGTDAIGCTYGTTTATINSPIDPIPPGFFPMGRFPLRPAVSGAGPDAIAISNGPFGQSGIFSVGPIVSGVALAQPLYESTEAFSAVAHGDIYGDGQIDAVASGLFDVEILRPLTDATGNVTFAAYRIPTSGATRGVVVADFDVDGHADIAYIETVGTVERMMMAWGSDGEPLPPVEIAQFPNVSAFVQVAVPDSNDPLDIIPDLAILQLDPSASALLTLMHGSPQRTLTAYFDPRTSFGSEFVGVVTGNFKGMARQDVLGVEVDETAPTQAIFWTIDGSTTAAFGGASAAPATKVLGGSAVDCVMAGGMLCTDTARYFTWSLADHDAVIAIDGAGHAVTLDKPQIEGAIAPVPCASCAALPGLTSNLALRGMFRANLAGSDELFLAYGAATNFGDTGGAVFHCQVDAATGVVTQCSDLLADAGLGDWSCNGAVTGPVSPRGRFDPVETPREDDVLLLCTKSAETAVFRIAWASGTYTSTLLFDLPGARYLVLADVTGDGVPDLCAAIALQGFPAVRVYPQCEARDVQCRAANSGGPTE